MSNMGKNMDYLRKGIKIHPGNPMYVFLIFALLLAGLSNERITTGLLAAGVFIVLLLIMWVCTSISVGKANYPDSNNEDE